MRLTPRGGRAAVEGAVQLADGRWAAKVRVSAPPVDGAANAALIAYLSEALRLPKSSFDIVAGATSRLKTVAIIADPATVAARLEAWLARPET